MAKEKMYENRRSAEESAKASLELAETGRNEALQKILDKEADFVSLCTNLENLRREHEQKC